MNKLFQIAQRSGVTVEYCHIPLNESISVEDAAGDFVLLDYGLISAGAKERTHLAYELGHCVTGSFYNRHSGLDVRQKHENRADKWAIEELIGEAALRSCIHNRLSKVWRWEILTIASAEEVEISKSLLSRLEWLSQERVRSTTQRQGSFSHWCGLIFSEISTSRPSCSFMSETKVPRYPASAQNFWIDGYRSYARLAVDIPPFVS